MVDFSNLTATWNDAGTDFDGIKLNVTDTASGAGSKLLDLQIDSAPHLRVTKNRELFLFNDYTDGSNYERGFVKFDSNEMRIGTESAGTGSNRNVGVYRGGSLYLAFDASSIVAYQNIIPNTAGIRDLGRVDLPFNDLFLRPSSSLTPNANGDLVVEATNNTTLTFKLKGSDSTVRSGTLTLS